MPKISRLMLEDTVHDVVRNTQGRHCSLRVWDEVADGIIGPEVPFPDRAIGPIKDQIIEDRP